MNRCHVLVPESRGIGIHRCWNAGYVLVGKKWHCRAHANMLKTGRKLRYSTSTDGAPEPTEWGS